MQIGLERSRLLELEEKADGLQGKIGTQRKAMGGVNAAREANIQVQHCMCFSHVHDASDDRHTVLVMNNSAKAASI